VTRWPRACRPLTDGRKELACERFLLNRYVEASGVSRPSVFQVSVVPMFSPVPSCCHGMSLNIAAPARKPVFPSLVNNISGGRLSTGAIST
jgi:hypothetical protein